MDLEVKYQSILNQIKPLLADHPKLCILGIGENRMGDDGIGQYIPFELDKQTFSSNILIINGTIVPEERLSEIVSFQPELMIIIDAVGGNSPRGAINLYKDDQILNYLPISSHSMPLPVFIDRCYSRIQGLKIQLLGISPYSLEFSDKYALFEEDKYTLDDKEANPNIPFYEFSLTEEMVQIGKDVVEIFTKLLEDY